MICEDMNEIKVELKTLRTLLWYFKPTGTCLDEDFGWGLGMILGHIESDIEACFAEVERKNV